MADSAQVQAFQQSNKDYYLPVLLSIYQQYSNIDQGRIVDLGSGTGDFDILLAKHYPGLRITGYDGSPAMVSTAQKNAQENKVDIDFQCKAFNLIEDSADLVISTNTLHHIHNPKIFWSTVCAISNNVFVVDLVRPVSNTHAEKIVEHFSSSASNWYKTDFYNSLLAAFSPEELQDQISNTNLILEILGDPDLAQLVVISGNFNKTKQQHELLSGFR